MATYSNNTTIKIGTSVSVYRNQVGTGSASDSYTVPAGCYLLLTKASKGVNPTYGGSASLTVTYPGFPAQDLDVPSTFEFVSDSSPPGQVSTNPFTLLLPSGSVINASLSCSGALQSANYQFLGQLYQNTP